MGRGDPYWLVFEMIALLSLLGIAMSATFLIDIDGEENTASDSAGTADSFDEGMEPRVPIDQALYFDEPLVVDGFYDLRDQVDVVSVAQNGNDEMLAGNGDDVLNGLGGNDQIFGGAGNDQITGDNGDDVIFGGAGDDVIAGDDDSDMLMGGRGDDVIFGGAGQDTLMGGAGDDVLDGRDDDQDVLSGGAGDDRILAGIGDQISTGSGSDTIVFSDAADATVDDFDPESDFVELEYEGETPPVLSTEKSDVGISLLADGEVILTMDDLDEFDLSMVKLIRV